MRFTDVERRWQRARRRFTTGEYSGTTFLRHLGPLREEAVAEGRDSLAYLIDLSSVPALARTSPEELLELIPRLRALHTSDPDRYPVDGSSFDAYVGHAPALAAENPDTSLATLRALLDVVTAPMGEQERLEAELGVAVLVGDAPTLKRLVVALPSFPVSDDLYARRCAHRAAAHLTLGNTDKAVEALRAIGEAPVLSATAAGLLVRLVTVLAAELDREEVIGYVGEVMSMAVGVPAAADSTVLVAAMLARAGMELMALRMVDSTAFDLDTAATQTSLAMVVSALAATFETAVDAGHGEVVLPRFTCPRWQGIFPGADGSVADLARRAREFVQHTATLFDARNANTFFSRTVVAASSVPPIHLEELPRGPRNAPAAHAQPPIALFPLPVAAPEYVAGVFYEAVGDHEAVKAALDGAPELPQSPDITEVQRLREVLLTADDDIAQGAAEDLGRAYTTAGQAARELIQMELLLSASLLPTTELLDVAVRALPAAQRLDPASTVGLALDVAKRYEALSGYSPQWQVVIDFATDVVAGDASEGEEVLIASDMLELIRQAVRGGKYLAALVVNRRLLKVYDADPAEASTWRITTLVGRAQLYSSIGNTRAALAVARDAHRLATEAENHELELQAVAVQLEVLFQRRDMATASQLADLYRDLPGGPHPLAEFLVRHGQAMVAATLLEPHFSEQWPRWRDKLEEAGERVLYRDAAATAQVMRRVTSLAGLAASLGHTGQAKELVAWLVAATSAHSKAPFANDALLAQAGLLHGLGEHDNAALIVESVVQRARRGEDQAGVDRALGTLKQWAKETEKPAYRAALDELA